MTESLARELVCIDCGTAHALGYRLECEKCRGLLELRYDLERLVQPAASEVKKPARKARAGKPSRT